MSVQQEIQRIESAKTSLKTAIESKGVTVPDGTKLDGYGALVGQIQSGGGGGGTTIPGLVELFKTSGLHYKPEVDFKILLHFSEWPSYFGVYSSFSAHDQNIFIGPSVYDGNMAYNLSVNGAFNINYVDFGGGFIDMSLIADTDYYFLSDVEMTIEVL